MSDINNDHWELSWYEGTFTIVDAIRQRIVAETEYEEYADLILALPQMKSLCNAIILAVDNDFPISLEGLRKLADDALAKAEGRDA